MDARVQKSAPYTVTIAGAIGIIALYTVTRTDARAITFGLEYAVNIEHLGMVSKIVQVEVVIGSVWAPV